MPRHEVLSYKVYPDGYDESTVGDKYNWVVTVERREQPDGTFKWRVSGRAESWYCYSSAGNRIQDAPRHRRYTRFDTLEDALAIAYKVVNTAGPMGWTLQQFEEHFRKRHEAEKTKETA
jgi:hypothetical protein